MKVSTGFESLDIISKGGLAIGDLLSISSSAGIGKTALSNQLAINLARQGMMVGIMGMETNVQLTSNQLCNNIHGCDISSLPNRTFEFAKLYPKYLKVLTFPNYELRSMLDSIERIKMQDKFTDFDVIIIDNITLLTEPTWFFIHYLKQFLYKCGLIGIITNQSSRIGDDYIKPRSDIHIEMLRNNSEYELIVTNNTENDQVYQLSTPVKLDENTRAITEMQK